MYEIYLSPTTIRNQILFPGFKPKKVLQIEHQPYLAGELNEELQEKIADDYRDINVDYGDWHEPIEEGLKEKLSAIGFRMKEAYFSGFSSQGDGACFTGQLDDCKKFMSHAINRGIFPTRVKLWKIYRNASYIAIIEDSSVTITTNNQYSHSGTMSFATEITTNDIDGEHTDLTQEELESIKARIKELLTDIADDYYRDLNQYYDDLRETEAVIETLDCNERYYNYEGEEWSK